MKSAAGVRSQQKLASRSKVLEAARDLFDQVGYEETTIRAIAERAGVSVGGVFITFASKADILGQVIADWLAGLMDELEVLAPQLDGACAERLDALFARMFAFEARRPRLFLAYLGVSYGAPSAPGRPFGHNPRLRAVICDTLRQGMASGELRADLDIDRAVDLLAAAYAWIFRCEAERGDAAAMSRAMRAQIDLLLTGMTPDLKPA